MLLTSPSDKDFVVWASVRLDGVLARWRQIQSRSLDLMKKRGSKSLM